MRFVLALASGGLAQHLQLDLDRVLPNQHIGIPTGLQQRAYYTESLANNLTGGGYYARVQVGGQDMTMVLDTGSSDAWVVSHQANLCTSQRLQKTYGDTCGETYNPSKSSTYALVREDGFRISYLDGTTAEGDYISDDFTIGGATVKSLQVGYATEVVRGTGILGVGYSTNVASRRQYSNLIDELVNQGLIGTKAYSLYLNDRRSTSGNILLGGVDTNKFFGPLSVLPILKAKGSENHTTLMVAMNGLGATFANRTALEISMSQANLPAILDSGTTLSYLPEDMCQGLFQAVGAYTDRRSTGLTFIDCKYLDKAEEAFFLNFTFGSDVHITVPVQEMVLDVITPGAASLMSSDLPFNDLCLFGIQSAGTFGSSKRSEHYRRQLSSTDFALLGDTFLRSAYVVYDLSNAQIAMAPANLNSTESNVTELKGDPDELATLTGTVNNQDTSVTAMPTVTHTITVDGSGRPIPSSGSDSGAWRPKEVPASWLFGLTGLTSLFVLLGGLVII